MKLSPENMTALVFKLWVSLGNYVLRIATRGLVQVTYQ